MDAFDLEPAGRGLRAGRLPASRQSRLGLSCAGRRGLWRGVRLTAGDLSQRWLDSRRVVRLTA